MGLPSSRDVEHRMSAELGVIEQPFHLFDDGFHRRVAMGAGGHVEAVGAVVGEVEEADIRKRLYGKASYVVQGLVEVERPVENLTSPHEQFELVGSRSRFANNQ
jgi:hypothetical protein